MATDAAPASMIEAARDKKKRYDRQLRLWGEHGQDALENAKICLLYATATGTETLKNLVLPGVGEITIVDPFQVTPRDLGKNFFVDQASLGKSRAETTARLLNELNDLITVKSVQEDPVKLIDNSPEFFKQFNFIIATDLPNKSLLKLEEIALANRSTFFFVRSIGFVGQLRSYAFEHRIYETKPDNAKPDLRVMNTFNELSDYADAFEIPADMDTHLHGHIPWLILLLKALKQWRASHDGAVPKNRAEQDAFRELIRSGRRSYEEDNFEEAANNAFHAWVPLRTPADVNKILRDEKTNITAESRPFWITARAVRDFVDNEGNGDLPVNGALPDMTADTKSFVTLQRIFREKANKDVDAVYVRVQALLKSIGRDENSIKKEYVARACKNAYFWKLMRFRTIREEQTNINANSVSMALGMLKDMDGECMPLYVMLRAADRFRDQFGTLPGDTDNEDDLPRQVAELQKIADAFVKELPEEAASIDTAKYAAEFVRYGGAELHNIAALMGGVAAQEMIKIVTEQMVPVNNNFIFNGMRSTTAVYEL
eukprot:TRINITY_DN3197_c0_g1_i1.p1 TRINITY_DN3197_c0_g1~~TRINITY_DN3197_c0_g1_i1.p1  ORF type:complete len:551 (+),score=162.64 TRINITY_DN3197_c0_g1_i1:26-1654(+)